MFARKNAAMTAPTAAQYTRVRKSRLGMPAPIDIEPMSMSIEPISIPDMSMMAVVASKPGRSSIRSC